MKNYKPILKIGAIIVSGIIFVLTLLAAYGGYINPHKFTLPSIAVLFFPYLAMLTLICALGWFIARQYVMGFIGVAVLLSCGPTFTAALPFRFPNNPQNPENSFKLVTFNCLHMEDIKKKDLDYNRSLSFLIHSEADFICLQELYNFAPPEVPAKYNAQLDSICEIYPYISTQNSREIEFLSKYPFKQFDVKLPYDISRGSCTAYQTAIEGHELTIINVHLPSYRLSDKEKEIIKQMTSSRGAKKSVREFKGSIYHKMGKAFQERAVVSKVIADYAESVKGDVIICGDFNDVPGSWSYRTFKKSGFEDAYANTSFGHIITYNSHLMFFHIDQVLYRGDLIPLSVKKVRLNSSDHYPLEAQFEFM